MEKKELKRKIREVIQEGQRGFIFSTVDEEANPRSRFMGALMLEDGFVVYLETASSSRKMIQLQANPRAQLLFFRPDYSEVATLSGKSAIVESLEKKKEFWDKVPSCKDYYPAYDSPEFAVIKFVPERIEYLNPKLQLAPFELKP